VRLCRDKMVCRWQTNCKL